MKGWGKERERLNEQHENQKGGTRERGGGGGGRDMWKEIKREGGSQQEKRTN